MLFNSCHSFQHVLSLHHPLWESRWIIWVSWPSLIYVNKINDICLLYRHQCFYVPFYHPKLHLLIIRLIETVFIQKESWLEKESCSDVPEKIWIKGWCWRLKLDSRKHFRKEELPWEPFQELHSLIKKKNLFFLLVHASIKKSLLLSESLLCSRNWESINQ